jgi:hypothetical protein
MLVYFSFPLIGCQYFRIKSIIVNDCDPVRSIPFFSCLLSFYLIQFLFCREVSERMSACEMCEKMTIISDRVMVECACVCLVTDMLCHKRNVFTYTQCNKKKSTGICMFCSESNCLLKSRYVSSNPLRYYHQSVCVTTRELTYSLWTCQTAWFYGTCFKHSLRRLTDLSLSLALELILSFWLSVCLKLIDVRSSWTITAVETICFEWLHDCLSLIMMMMMVVYYGIRE